MYHNFTDCISDKENDKVFIEVVVFPVTDYSRVTVESSFFRCLNNFLRHFLPIFYFVF